MKCSKCGKTIPRDGGYVLKTVLYAAFDGLEFSPEDLSKDFEEEIKVLLERIGKTSKKKLEEDVAIYNKLRLCRKCRDKIFHLLKEYGVLK